MAIWQKAKRRKDAAVKISLCLFCKHFKGVIKTKAKCTSCGNEWEYTRSSERQHCPSCRQIYKAFKKEPKTKFYEKRGR